MKIDFSKLKIGDTLLCILDYQVDNLSACFAGKEYKILRKEKSLGKYYIRLQQDCCGICSKEGMFHWEDEKIFEVNFCLPSRSLSSVLRQALVNDAQPNNLKEILNLT